MTPTGKADVKERARQFLKKRADVGPLECIWCGVIHSASCDKEAVIVADMADFAESEALLARKEMPTEEIVRLRKKLKAELNLRRLQPAVPMEVIDTMPKDEAEPVSRCNLQSPMEAEAQLQSCLNCGHPPHPEGQLPMASGSHVFFSRGREVRSSSTLTAEPQPQSAGPRCPECGATSVYFPVDQRVQELARKIVQRIYEVPCSTPTPIVEEILRSELEGKLAVTTTNLGNYIHKSLTP